MKTVDRLIVEHIIIQLNTPNREVERILMNSPTLLNFAANTILTRNMSFLFLEKGITHFRKNHTMIKNSFWIKNQTASTSQSPYFFQMETSII